jgi:hypothetical protein
MKEFTEKLKGLDAGHWITIAVILLTAAVEYGNSSAQIGELSRSQARVETSQQQLTIILDSVVSEQARVKQQLDDHIQMTTQHFREMEKK